MDVVVARIGKAHGLRGEVTVEVRTDAPRSGSCPAPASRPTRAAAGPAAAGDASRDHNGTLLLGFAGVPDRTAAEGLRGVLLLADTDEAGGRRGRVVREGPGRPRASSPSPVSRVGEVVGPGAPARPRTCWWSG